ncbi:DUF6069 family protein [Streptosporangium roseum]|uniref:Uncharacterized protein n=1 Tax=Streptosporangium roseum (strain ATCC 12428 / DSM 43021 / JCM 3005 / KCTC 9067 / NCIMB 10171 / NRRL 2505 / NI 9100) TaxID=479432 RepID=D2B341_STRRD|nr:DUF6069 family protein [Streptosporangium roseum]ACZ85521.1 hypothetical protein Sros_2547 [Streptosporangium roseum DSM 43021]
MNTSAKRILLTVAGAPAAALAVWALAVPVAGTTPTVRMGTGTQPVEPGSVLVVSLLVGLAGWALLTVLERFASRPGRIWTIVALAVLVLSLLGPFGSAVGIPTMLVLILMHLVVGIVLVLGLTPR